MALDKDKLEKLSKLITMAKIVEKFLALEKKFDNKLTDNNAKFETLTNEFKEVIEESKVENNKFGGLRQKTLEAINNLFVKNDINKKLNEKLGEANALFARIDDKLSKVRNGRDADDKAILEAVLAQIKPAEDGHTPTIEELEAIIKPLIPEPIKGDTGKVDDGKIKALEDEIEALKRMLRRKGGGGTSAMGVAQAMKRILKTEEPVGAINGVNKVYTVSSTIFAVFAFSLNGEVVTQLPNYTIAGNKITFAVALPAAYSGKDFEIKYI